MKDNYMAAVSSQQQQRSSLQAAVNTANATSQMLANNKTYNASIGQRPQSSGGNQSISLLNNYQTSKSSLKIEDAR
jgi:hypothetical protein